MPSYRYQALDASGAATEGTLTAPDRMTAMRQLQSRGEIPISLEAGEDAPPAGSPTATAERADLLAFLRR